MSCRVHGGSGKWHAVRRKQNRIKKFSILSQPSLRRNAIGFKCMRNATALPVSGMAILSHSGTDLQCLDRWDVFLPFAPLHFSLTPTPSLVHAAHLLCYTFYATFLVSLLFLLTFPLSFLHILFLLFPFYFFFSLHPLIAFHHRFLDVTLSLAIHTSSRQEQETRHI